MENINNINQSINNTQGNNTMNTEPQHPLAFAHMNKDLLGERIDVTKQNKELTEKIDTLTRSLDLAIIHKEAAQQRFRDLSKHEGQILTTIRDFIISQVNEDNGWVENNQEFYEAMIEYGMRGLTRTVNIERTYTVHVEIQAQVDWEWDGTDEDSLIECNVDEDSFSGYLFDNADDVDVTVDVNEKESYRTMTIEINDQQ